MDPRTGKDANDGISGNTAKYTVLKNLPSSRQSGGLQAMAVTLRDVAALAKVSPVVVSRVLHNKALAINVTEATAERVRVAALELGYRRNVSAVSFRTKQTMTIGVLHGAGMVMPRFEGGSKYFSALMDGFVAGAFANDYSVTLCPKLLGPSPDDAMSDGRFDGLVLYSTDLTEENLWSLQRCSVPLVLVHSKSSEFGGKVPSVVCDNFQGIGLAMDHLIDLGHSRIAFAQDPWLLSTEIRDRRAAYLSIAEKSGLPVGIEDVITIESDEMLVDLVKGPYTAIIAWNETLAGRILTTAGEVGIGVPGDLSVVGFDSTSYCDVLRPALTSVSQPLFQIGVRAIELLVAYMRGEISGLVELTYPCGFDVRGSTMSIAVQVNNES